MKIGPFPATLWEVISTHSRYYGRLGLDGSPSPQRPNLQAIARLLLEAKHPEGYSAKRAASPSASFKTEHRRGQIKRFFDGDPKYRYIGLEIMECLHFQAKDFQRVMGGGDQVVDLDDLKVRPGVPADAGEIERLGRQILGDRQSSARKMKSRMQSGLERSLVVEDGPSSLRGFLRWWVLRPEGVALILNGDALTGGELRNADLTVADFPPGGALYIVMILGVDPVAGCRMTSAAKQLVKRYGAEALSTFTRPSTCIGLKMVKRRRIGFSRVAQPGSRIFLRPAMP